MNNGYIKILRIIENQVSKVSVPYVTRVSDRRRDSFKVLVSCILSLRTKMMLQLKQANLFLR